MAQQKLDKQSGVSTTENPKFLRHSGTLVEWEKATVHVSMLGWTAISAVFEGIRAYWNPNGGELYVFKL